MTTHDILKILQEEIHTVIMASVDDRGIPYTCAIDLMLLEEETLYFLTARGKSFYQRLMNHPNIALTGLKGEDTMSSIAISLNGRVQNIGHEKLKDIFEKNTYMNQIYPHLESRDALEVFQIYQCQGEYFDLSQKPILRQSFAVGKDILMQGYKVTDQCMGCLKCYHVCPQCCIDKSVQPVVIQQNHCLHCGKCYEVCPAKAIEKVGV